MIEFPETARVEWQLIHDAAQVEKDLRARIARDTLVETELDRLRVRHQAGEKFQQELDADSTPALEMFTVADYKASPTMGVSDLIDGVMKDKGLLIVMGPSGAGKTTFTLQVAHSLLTGTPFLGQPVQQITGSVGVVSYDMDGSLMADWATGFPGSIGDRISVVNAYKRGNPLGVPALREQIIKAWQGQGVEVVLIDSFSGSFFGENENDQATVKAHYRDLVQFALTEVGARGVIIISHSTANSPHKIRGSTVHHDVADSICAIVADPKDPDPDKAPREVRMVKYRQHRTGAGTMSHQMAPVIIGQPDDVTHLVEINPGGMTMAGLTPAPHLLGSSLFPDAPPPDAPPDLDSTGPTEDEGDDDL